jgi:hypothetical protein
MEKIIKFGEFNVINEEEGLINNLVLAASLLFSNINYSADKDISNGIVKDVVSLNMNILESSTSSKGTSNTLLQKIYGLPSGNSKYWQCKLSDLKRIDKNDTDKLLSCFIPYTGKNIKSNDYLKIGDRELSETGTQIFNFTKGDNVVIASGNGLLNLTRAMRQMDKSKRYLSLKVSFNSDRSSKEIEYNSQSAVFLNPFMNTLKDLFEITITPEIKYHNESRGKIVNKIMFTLNEQQKIDFIYNFINKLPNRFMSKDLSSQSDITFNKFSKDKLDSFYNDIKDDKFIDNGKFDKFKEEIKNFYIGNFVKFANVYYPGNEKKVIDNMLNNITYKNDAPRHSWEKVGNIGSKSYTSEFKKKNKEYEDGK